MVKRRAGSVLALVLVCGALSTARAESVLRYGIAYSDVPLTTGEPDNGAGAFQFTGNTIYDPLIAWDLSRADQPSRLVPGLATEWHEDPADPTKWRFTLRRGVKFHDGSDFNADAVIWNLDKILDNKAPQFDAHQSVQVKPRLPSLVGYRKLDDDTVELTASEADAFFPYQLPFLYFSSPAQYEKLGRDWEKFAYAPSGTGPFKLVSLVPRERAELVRNEAYWDPARRAKLDRLILLPIPDPNARLTALLSGQVDLIEAPPPDAVDRIKQGGMRVVQNVMPHVWPYTFNLQPGSPWADIRVRKAANLAVDRAGIVALMHGLAIAAKGQVDPGSPWFGTPSFDLRYDPEAAKRLLAEAGYSKAKPVTAKIVISGNGGTQMLSLPMNEYIQQTLGEVGINVSFEVVELTTLVNHWRSGALADINKPFSAINVTYVTIDPFYALVRFLDSRYTAPRGFNWGGYDNPVVDKLLARARTTADIAQQNALLAQIHTIFVDDAVFLWVVHDVNPHALSPKVGDFVLAQNWFQDLTRISAAH
jgi:peptide/nickel transport system substrate-binding protein